MKIPVVNLSADEPFAKAAAPSSVDLFRCQLNVEQAQIAFERSCSYHGMCLERPARRDVMAGEHHVEMIAAAIEDVKCSRYHA